MSANRWRRVLAASSRAALASKGADGARCKLTPVQLAEPDRGAERRAGRLWIAARRHHDGGHSFIDAQIDHL
jgi:hypothetical protein